MIKNPPIKNIISLGLFKVFAGKSFHTFLTIAVPNPSLNDFLINFERLSACKCLISISGSNKIKYPFLNNLQLNSSSSQGYSEYLRKNI